MEETKCETIVLSGRQQVSFLLDIKDEAIIEVLTGKAFYCGWSLPERRATPFRNQSFGIYTMDGCSLRVTGSYTTFYAYELPSIHSFFDEMTRLLMQNPAITLITGAPGTGKTTTCKQLLNNIFREGKLPIYVAADPSQGLGFPPGCLTALPLSFPIDNFGFPYCDPICFFYGAAKLESERLPLYVAQIEELNKTVQERRRGYNDGGIIIEFPSISTASTSACEMEALNQVVELFHVEHILVVGNDWLHGILEKKYRSLRVHKLPRIRESVPFSNEQRTFLRDAATKRYFYGDGNPDLIPHQYEMAAKGELEFFKLGMSGQMGRREGFDPKTAIKFFPNTLDSFNGLVMAIVPSVNKGDLWKQNVLGFLTGLKMDCGESLDETQLHVLKPNQEDLPSKTCIVGQDRSSVQ